MDKKMLSALEKDARLTPRELSVMFAREEESVRSEIEACEKDGTILGYRTVVNWDKVGREAVSALIELKITPVRDRGFDAVAERVCNYPEVKSVYLMSGGFDLCLIVEGHTMRDVAYFVAEKLATIDGVASTAPHFVLQRYKDGGIVFDNEETDKRGNDW